MFDVFLKLCFLSSSAVSVVAFSGIISHSYHLHWIVVDSSTSCPCFKRSRAEAFWPGVPWKVCLWWREEHFSIQSISFHYFHLVISGPGWCPVLGWMCIFISTDASVTLLARECLLLNLASVFPSSISVCFDVYSTFSNAEWTHSALCILHCLLLQGHYGLKLLP